MQKVDIDKAMQRFFSDISEYETYDYEEEDEYGKTVHTGTYVSPEETTLSYGPASSRFVYMKRDLMPYVQNTFIPFQDDRYNADLYSTEMELSFMNRETAFGEIEDALTEIGIEAETDYISYALDYEHMQSQEYHEDMDGNIDRNQYKDQWSSADDCYWFFINQTYHGIPLYHVYNNVFSMVAEDNVPMEAVVSAEGIEWLNIEKVFEFSNENKGVSLAGIDAIVQTVADKYNQVLGDFTYEMTKAQLLAAFEGIALDTDVLYVFSLVMYGMPAMILFICGAFAFADSFCEDTERRYMMQQIIRGSVETYVSARILTVFFTAVFVTALGIFLFANMLHIRLEWVNASDLQHYEHMLCSGGLKLFLKNRWFELYFLGYGMVYGILAGILSLWASYLSLYVSNRMLVLAAPLILYYFTDYILSGLFPGMVNLSLIFSPSNNLFSNDLMPVLLVLLIAVINILLI